MELDAKAVLYSIIDKMGKDGIESEIASHPSKIPQIINDICFNCMKTLNSYHDYDRPKILSDILEALMHYLLTVCLIPSERKVEYEKNLTLGLVIPTLRQLKTDPNRALIILFPKNNDAASVNAQIGRLLRVQPKRENIWLVFGHYSDELIRACDGFRAYIYDDFVKGSLKPFSTIIDDIKSFVESNKIKGFKIFRSN